MSIWCYQVQIAKAFENEGKVLACYDIKSLGKVIKLAKKFKPKIIRRRPSMLKIIKNFLKEIENDRYFMG